MILNKIIINEYIYTYFKESRMILEREISDMNQTKIPENKTETADIYLTTYRARSEI